MDDLEYDQEDDFNAAYSDDLEDDREIEQDMVWHVIDKYFHTKGLVGQQIDSFDEFISLVLQDLPHGTQFKLNKCLKGTNNVCVLLSTGMFGCVDI